MEVSSQINEKDGENRRSILCRESLPTPALSGTTLSSPVTRCPQWTIHGCNIFLIQVARVDLLARGLRWAIAPGTADRQGGSVCHTGAPHPYYLSVSPGLLLSRESYITAHLLLSFCSQKILVSLMTHKTL